MYVKRLIETNSEPPMNRKISELSIPVPWGFIQAKAWGNEEDEILLLFHGRLDNAGSFDNLIPLLPTNFYYVCIDLPSHGKSSPLPQFLPIQTLNYLIIYKLIVNYFKKSSYIIIGHSIGAVLGQIFSRLYPQHVKKLVLIDGIILEPVEASSQLQQLVRTIDGVIYIHEKSMTGNKPEYTYKEALERFQKGREGGPLTKEHADVISRALLNRGLESVGDGKYRFTVDQRMKFLFDPLQDMRYVLEGLRRTPVSCPVLIILARDTLPAVKRTYPCLELVNTWTNATLIFVEGGHDVHITNPERFANYISDFLTKQYCKM